MSSEHKEETDEEFYSKYEAYFNRSDIDGWEARKAMGDLACQDAIAEPKVRESIDYDNFEFPILIHFSNRLSSLH